MNRLSLRWTPARLLGAVSFAVVSAFVGANVYAQQEMLAIDGNALALVDSIAPRIDRLTTLRGAIYRMDRAVRDAVAGRSTLLAAQAAAEQERGVITSQMAALATSPVAVEWFERCAHRALSLVGSGDVSAARQEVDALAESFAAVDKEIHDLVTSSASDAARDGARIERLRKHASTVAYTLNALATVLSLALIAIALRIARQNQRLVAEHAAAVEQRNLLVERRASELEAFAARVAHDLKSPLAAIRLRMSLMKRRAAAPTQGEIERVEQTLQRLVRIIDGLLAFASSGGAPDQAATTQVLPVVKEVVHDLDAEAEAAGVVLQTTSVDPSIAVGCPGATLSTILDNLVRNAVKFVVDGASSAHVVVVRAERRSAVVRVEVEDNGPGVPEGQETMIFEPYARGRGAHQPGLGIGLATVKRLVEAYGGGLGVRSHAGAGSCFWFELPAR